MKDSDDEFDAINAHTTIARQTVDSRANQFAFAGLAAVWIFRAGTGLGLPRSLLLPGGLFVLTLAFDLLDWLVQYAVQADPLRVQRWLHEADVPWYRSIVMDRKNVGGVGSFTIPLSRLLFALKLISLFAGYALLLRYLLHQLTWAA